MPLQIVGRINYSWMSDEGKLKTAIRYLRRRIEEGMIDPIVLKTARSLTRNCRNKDYACETKILLRAIQSLHYWKDPYKKEWFQSPRRTLIEKGGDCDDLSACLAAMLLSIGHRVRLIITDTKLDGEYNHVYVEDFLDGEWIACETTEPYALGKRPPGKKRMTVNI